MKHLILILLALLVSTIASATDFMLPPEPFVKGHNTFRVGLLAGQAGLTSDVAGEEENGFSRGLSAGLFLKRNLLLEADYTSSSHANTKHSALSFGGSYYLGSYQSAFPNISAGMSFVSNELTNIRVTGDGLAAYIGGGFDYEINPGFTAGLQVRYQKGFGGRIRIDGIDYVTVGDATTAMLRLMYYFGAEE